MAEAEDGKCSLCKCVYAKWFSDLLMSVVPCMNNFTLNKKNMEIYCEWQFLEKWAKSNVTGIFIQMHWSCGLIKNTIFIINTKKEHQEHERIVSGDQRKAKHLSIAFL